MTRKLSPEESARRAFVKKAAYIAPAVVSLAAASSFAKAGSLKPPLDRPGHLPTHPEQPPVINE